MFGMNFEKLLAVTVICFTVIATTTARTSNTRCAINLNQDLGDPAPLYIVPGTEDFLLPRTSAGVIRMNQGAPVELFCSTGFRTPQILGQLAIATCLGGTTFELADEELEFSEIICNNMPKHTTRRTNHKCPGGEIAQIGYQVEDRWLNLMDVCQDERISVTHWVHHFQDPWNRGNQRGFPRIEFIQGDFFNGLRINNLYMRGRHRITIANILGSQKMAANIIPAVGDLFLSRGHLAARTDYMLGSHQQATFYFINAAPQWQTFNGGNWERVETGLRNEVDRSNWHVELYTGTHGILKLNDTNGVPQEVYLHTASGRNDINRVPVPKIFYKIAIEHSLKAGIVFIGVNNPYATLDEIKNDFTYCTDISDKVNYIPWNKHNITFGYSYACEVAEFVKRIPELPEIPTVDRLLL